MKAKIYWETTVTIARGNAPYNRQSSQEALRAVYHFLQTKSDLVQMTGIAVSSCAVLDRKKCEKRGDVRISDILNFIKGWCTCKYGDPDAFTATFTWKELENLPEVYGNETND